MSACQPAHDTGGCSQGRRKRQDLLTMSQHLVPKCGTSERPPLEDRRSERCVNCLTILSLKHKHVEQHRTQVFQSLPGQGRSPMELMGPPAHLRFESVLGSTNANIDPASVKLQCPSMSMSRIIGTSASCLFLALGHPESCTSRM